MGRPAIPSVLEGPTGPTPKAQLDAMELIQSVQDLAGSVPLTAGKRTFVRAYLGLTAAPLLVQGELRVAQRAHGPWTKLPADAEHVRFRVLTTNGISYTEVTTQDLNIDEL
jgi:hypothetical protein